MDEFLDMHYGKAAPPIRRFINLIHDKAEPIRDEGLAPKRPDQYGIDESVIQEGLKAFDQALRLADDEVIRNRVEKVSICAYALAVYDVWRYAELLHWNAVEGPLDPEVARRTRPYAKKLFELCVKHGVTRWDEQTFSTEYLYDLFRRSYGLKEDEPL